MLRRILIIACIVLFAFLYLGGFVPLYFVVFYLLMSVLTFFIYALDKSAARKNHWRVRENTLHYLAISGGWFGALLAQQWLNHKSTKKRFQLLFYSTIALNIVLVVCILNSQRLLE